MVFDTSEGDAIYAIVNTSDLYNGNNTPHIRVVARNSQEREDFPVHQEGEHGSAFRLRRQIGASTVTIVPGTAGGTFVVQRTGKPNCSIRTGHSYSSLVGISPCGEYVAYIVPGSFWVRHGRTFVHHLETGRRAMLDVSPRGRLLSWEEAR